MGTPAGQSTGIDRTLAEFVTATEVAKRLKLPEHRLRRLIADPGSKFPEPHARVGRSTIWSWEAVEHWAAGPAAPPAELAKGSYRRGSTATRRITGRRRDASDEFVGRHQELVALSRALKASRLVVLTGPAGVGKTRLAREVARRLESAFASGSNVIELAATSDALRVPQTVAAALSVWEQPGMPLQETLISSLAGRHLLLVLDNCEQIADACRSLVEALLGGCPRLSILATSQVRLGAPGEKVRVLSPLSLPDAGDSLDRLSRSDAVRLFTMRAVVANPDVQLDERNIPIVAEICRRLDGLPLAIELAAARSGVMPPAEILAHLNDPFAFLTSGDRMALPRHERLQTAVDWSYSLCTSAEQQLLRTLSVFANGFSLEAAMAVCGANEAESSLLDPLAGLVAKSLIKADVSGDRTRYRVLQTLRQYGEARLIEAGESEAAHARLSHWCADYAETAAPHLTGRGQGIWLSNLATEHENLRAGLAWALDRRDAEVAGRIAASLTIFWRVRSHFKEGLHALDAVLAVDDEMSPGLKVRVLWGIGFMALMLGDADRCNSALNDCLALARRIGDRCTEARSLMLLANWLFATASLDRIVEFLAESLVLQR